MPRTFVAVELALAGVDARTDVDAELPQRVADRERAADGARRTVERGEEPVAGGVDLAAAKPLELAPNRGVVRAEELAPAAIAELHGPLRRADDVGEENRGEDAVGLRGGPRPGHELLDLVRERVDVTGGDPVVVTRQLDELRAGDSCGEIPPLLDGDVAVARPVEHERRHLDRGEDVPDVDEGVHADEGGSGTGACRSGGRYRSRLRMNCSSSTLLGA